MLRPGAFIFKLGNKNVDFKEEYKYLGLTINEYLDYQFSTNILINIRFGWSSPVLDYHKDD